MLEAVGNSGSDSSGDMCRLLILRYLKWPWLDPVQYKVG